MSYIEDYCTKRGTSYGPSLDLNPDFSSNNWWPQRDLRLAWLDALRLGNLTQPAWMFHQNLAISSQVVKRVLVLGQIVAWIQRFSQVPHKFSLYVSHCCPQPALYIILSCTQSLASLCQEETYRTWIAREFDCRIQQVATGIESLDLTG